MASKKTATHAVHRGAGVSPAVRIIVKISEMGDPEFNLGDRVVLQGNWEFPDGTVGTITAPTAFMIRLAGKGEWQGHRRVTKARRGMMTFYYVVFDTPTDDGSGDGPYRGGEIDVGSLRLLST